MSPFWALTDKKLRLKSRDEVAWPLDLALEQAQPHLNFVVYAPAALPNGCRIVSTSVRPEQPPGRPEGITAQEIGQTPWSEANPCSVRTLIAGEARSLRLKQFLYDWAPPAASIAPLWESPWLEGFECQDTVGWIGQDYREAVGACVQLDRTQIELSVIEGHFSHQEIRQLLSHLRTADPEAATVVRSTPFHLLNYWVRYGILPYRVPHGLWRYPHRRPYESGQILARADYSSVQRICVLLPGDEAFRFDSGFASCDEVETIFRHIARPSLSAWLLTVRSDSPRALTLPPEPEKQTAEIRTQHAIRGRDGWIALLDRRWGAWEGWWEEGGYQYIVWLSASPFWSEQWFFEFLIGLKSA
jgi:hypothetical protein